jgi:hypothetical protein
MNQSNEEIVREHYKKIGKAGNAKLRSLYTKKQLREWAKKGGRPRKKSGDKSLLQNSAGELL